MKKVLTVLSFALLGLLSTSALAQDTMSVTVEVKDGTTERAVAETPVFLRAARPKGPFEPQDPEPVVELTGITDVSGQATFDNVPRDLATRGLRLQAVTAYGGMTFKSTPTTPAPGLRIELPVYEKGISPDGIAFNSVRTVVEIWEGYVVFTQYYMLTNKGQTALDMTLVEGADPEKGLPIELSPLAKGIQASGPGQNVVVNSTLFWKGTLTPGETVPLQVRFSMTETGEEFVYEQKMDFPVDEVELVFPVQTKYKKVPRLDELTLAAPGFEVLSGKGILGLRNDLEFIGARGKSVEAGESFRFRLAGLPFKHPIAPWIVLGISLFVGALVVFFGRREAKKMDSKQTRTQLLKDLENEREVLLEELVNVQGDFEAGEITEREREFETLALKERLALVMNKIQELQA